MTTLKKKEKKLDRTRATLTLALLVSLSFLPFATCALIVLSIEGRRRRRAAGQEILMRTNQTKPNQTE